MTQNISVYSYVTVDNVHVSAEAPTNAAIGRALEQFMADNPEVVSVSASTSEAADRPTGFSGGPLVSTQHVPDEGPLAGELVTTVREVRVGSDPEFAAVQFARRLWATGDYAAVGVTVRDAVVWACYEQAA